MCVELSGYLLEELRDAKNFEAFKKDVATGGWVGGSRRWQAGQPVCVGLQPRLAPSHHAPPPTDPTRTPPHLPAPRCAANLFIGSLIFIEELADKIVEAVGPARDSLDACLVFPSMPAVMKVRVEGGWVVLGEVLVGVGRGLGRGRDAEGGAGGAVLCRCRMTTASPPQPLLL